MKTCISVPIQFHTSLPTSPPLMPIKGSPTGRPFAQILMDFITNLPKSHGYDSIMVMVDNGLMKGVILCPCNKTITAKGTVELLLNNVYKCFGLPDKAILDWGPQFASRAFWELGKQLGINLTMSTAYHPQTDEATKWSNQEIEAYLCIFCGNNPEEWSNTRVFLQSETTCQDAETHILPHVQRKPNGNTYCLSEDQPTLSKQLIRIPLPHPRQSMSHTQISKTANVTKNHQQVQTIPERR